MNNKIVFLHKWRGRVSSWEKNIIYFTEKGFDCYAVKMPGFDLPDPNPSWGIPEYAEFIVQELTKRFGNERFNLVGHSFGGRLAIYISAKHPELVEKLILTNAAGLNLESQGMHINLIVVSKALSNLEKVFGPLTTLRNIGRNLLGSEGYKKVSPVMQEIMKRVVNLDLRSCLGSITSKTLIVWGDEDKVTPLEMAKILNTYIAGSKLVIIPGAEHNPHFTHSSEWNEEVLAFLQN